MYPHNMHFLFAPCTPSQQRHLVILCHEWLLVLLLGEKKQKEKRKKQKEKEREREGKKERRNENKENDEKEKNEKQREKIYLNFVLNIKDEADDIFFNPLVIL